MGRILIVDDEPNLQGILSSDLEQDGHLIFHAAGIEEARRALASNQYEAIVADLKMQYGLDVLAVALTADPDISVIFLATEGTLELAAESIGRGAFNVITKPFAPEVLRAVIQRACDYTGLLRERTLLKATIARLQGTASSGNGHATANMAWMENLPASFDLRSLLSTVEKTLIERTLQSTHGAQAEAARRLGLSRSDLSYKLLKYELRKVNTSS